LDEQLERLSTDYIDFYLLHGLNRTMWDNLVKYEVSGFLESALKSEKINFAGFSFHDDLALFKEIVDAYDWAFCQIQYNYFDENFQAGREGLEYAAQRDPAIVVMEPLRGGSLAGRLPSESKQVLNEAVPDRSAVDWALRWVWKHPEVSVVLSGMSHLEHVKENLALAENVSNAPWTEKESEAIKKAKRIIEELQRVNCTACGYCLPCPQGVNIPRNFQLFNDRHVFHDPSATMRYQGFLGESEKASNCVQCGQCEEHCPQQISIPEELEHVAELFES
jgi:predicted aldo/keto reductase-like oxidoreductase